MNERNHRPGFGGPTRRLRPQKISALILLLICSMLASLASVALAANPSADIDQCANDPAPSSHTDGCNSNANQWVNGNLGASKAVYNEGDSIPVG
jgi:hypothetical protein